MIPIDFLLFLPSISSSVCKRATSARASESSWRSRSTSAGQRSSWMLRSSWRRSACSFDSRAWSRRLWSSSTCGDSRSL